MNLRRCNGAKEGEGAAVQPSLAALNEFSNKFGLWRTDGEEKEKGTAEMASMDLDVILISEDESCDESDLSEMEEEEDDDDDDDSDLDPSFDLIDETEKALSNLSMRKTKSSKVEKQEHEDVDLKSFEAVEELIKDGKLDKLKIDQCKVYLKKHGLRRTGKKDILLSRIKEHLELKDGVGDRKYPISSFILNCQGDACMGDVVMFEQNVYDMFSIASRSATGPPLGKRIVAGRIVHESYGEAKQQHTFTIEILWSKGEKPLPPLHPLLIKGRNLYKLKTMRQKWDNEEERNKFLQEKHERGNVARLLRERRIQEKEIRKAHRENRRTEKSHGNKATNIKTNLRDSTNLTNHEQRRENFPQKQAHVQQAQPTTSNLGFVQASVNLPRAVEQPQPLRKDPNIRLNHSLVYPSNGYPGRAVDQDTSVSRLQHQPSHELYHARQGLINGYVSQQGTFHRWGPQRHGNNGYSAPGFSHYGQIERRNVPLVPRQLCRYHVQGRCRFGNACKFSHE